MKKSFYWSVALVAVFLALGAFGVKVFAQEAPVDPVPPVEDPAPVVDETPAPEEPAPLIDTDADGIADDVDNCPADANADQADVDADSVGDACDAVDDSTPVDPAPIVDTDGDTVANDVDNCPTVANLDQVDTDSNGVGDVCETPAEPEVLGDSTEDTQPAFDWSEITEEGATDGDFDDDGVADEDDNCLIIPNKDQVDANENNIGDACEDAGFSEGSAEDVGIVAKAFSFVLPSDPDVHFCHYTGSGYTYGVDTTLTEVIALLHALLPGHSNDIVEPFHFGFLNILFHPGRNWTPENEELLANGCQPITVSTVTICKLDENDNYLSGWQVLLKGTHIESLLVDSTDVDGTNSTTLDGSKSYIVNAYGTWSNQNGANLADAEYSTTDGWASNIMDGYDGYGTDILELNIGGDFNIFGNWGAYNADHSYWQGLTPTATGSEQFVIFDGHDGAQDLSWFGDNAGSLGVDIYEGYTGITEGNGCVIFDEVPFGAYTLDEVMQDGWKNVSGVGDEVTVDDSEETFELVNRGYGSVFGQKWEDHNANGQEEGGDQGLEGWTIYAYPYDAPLTLDKIVLEYDYSTITDAEGNYTLELPTGQYNVCEEQQDGWTQTFPGDNGCHSVVIETGEEVDDQDFGNHRQTGVIMGWKWNDIDGNLATDYGEAYLPDWGINVYAGTVDETPEYSTTTDRFGAFSFELPTGEYYVCEVQQEGWTQTAPNNPPPFNTCYYVNVFDGASLPGYSFGNQLDDDTTITIIKETNPDGSDALFNFFVNNAPFTTLGDGESSGPIEVLPGINDIVEVQEVGWDLGASNVLCENTDYPGGPGNAGLANDNGVYMNLSEGDTIVCTFTNTYVGDDDDDSTPDFVKVHIYKYLDDGETMTQVSDESGLTPFPMRATWDTTNIGAGEGDYVLGNQHGGADFLYAADTSPMATPVALYTSFERTTAVDETSQVLPIGAQCEAEMYRLVGYKWGTSLYNAETAELSNTAPTFEDFSQDEYVIVVNEDCDTVIEQAQSCLVSGYKYDDEGNPLEGWTIGLEGNYPTIYADDDDYSGGFIGEDITDSNGYYCIPGVVDGPGSNYEVYEELQDGWSPAWAIVNGSSTTTPNVSYGNAYVDVPYIGDGMTVNFYNDDASVSGYKWNDLDGDGYHDEDEQRLPNWLVTLYGTDDGTFVLATTTTDESGNYSFGNMSSNHTYKICEGSVDGWSQTYPVNGESVSEDCYNIGYGWFEDGEDQYGYVFGNHENQSVTNDDGPSGRPSTHRHSGGGSNGGGQVLGATTDTNFCPFLLSYLKLGGENNADEINKAKAFFNAYFGLNLPLDGIFDQSLFGAVVDFQNIFKADILDTWVDEYPFLDDNATGFIYQTTLWKINSLVCPGYQAFPDTLVIPTN